MSGKPKQAKHDWLSIKRDYVEGMANGEGLHWPTLEEVAEKYKVRHGYVVQRAAKEKWTDAKNIYRRKVEDARQDKRSDLLASKGAEFDATFLQIAETLGGMIKLRMNELNAKQADGKVKASEAQELTRLTIAARNAHAMGRVALGESGDGPPLGFPNQFPVYRVPRPSGTPDE